MARPPIFTRFTPGLARPCREDAYRMLMRCYIRRGERAAALNLYRRCVDILRAEFDAVPEPTTTALFEQIRLDVILRLVLDKSG